MGIYNDPQYFEKRIKYQRKRRSAVISAIRAHFIRPCYLRESEAPMKFYKLIARIGLPLGFILNLFRAMQATAAIGTATEAARPYFIIDAVYMWVGIILLFGALVGLNKMKWAGVKYYASLFGWQIVYRVFLATYSASLELFEFEYFGQNIFAAIFLSVWLYFCMIYFGKRRLLFSPGAFNDPPEWTPSPDGEPAFHDQSARNSITPPKVEPEPPSEPEITAESNPPAVIPEKPAKKVKPRTLVIGLVVALVLSLAGNIWQGISWANNSAESAEKIRVLNNKLTQKEEVLEEYRTKVGDLNTELARVKAQKEGLYDHLDAALFLYNNIGFIVNGSSYYHNYECPVFQAASEYWAHNIEYCQSIGYGACPVCWD